MLETVALQSSEVVAVAELVEQVLEYLPVAQARAAAVDLLQVFLEILLNRVVVDQRVVNIDEKDDRLSQRHLRCPAPLSPSFEPAKRDAFGCLAGRAFDRTHRSLATKLHRLGKRSACLAAICAILPQTPPANCAQRAGITRPRRRVGSDQWVAHSAAAARGGSGFVSGMNIQSMARANKPMAVMLKK